MNKKIYALAALAAVALPAWAAEVYSSNIVGYQKVNLDAATYKMGGIQFVGVGEAAVSLNDLFTGDIAYGTQIMFLDDSGAYDIYTYLEEAYDEEADDFVPGWGDGFENLVSAETLPVTAGTGFWYYPEEGTTVTQAGQVSTNETITVNVPAGQYTLVSNPFPKGFNPNDVTWNADLPYGSEILTRDENGAYDIYTYLEEAYDEESDDFVPGWGDGFENLVAAPIADVGEGFWVKSETDATITFTLSGN